MPDTGWVCSIGPTTVAFVKLALSRLIYFSCETLRLFESRHVVAPDILDCD